MITNNYISVVFAFLAAIRLMMAFFKYRNAFSGKVMEMLGKCAPFRLSLQYFILVFVLAFLLIDRINVSMAYIIIHAFFFLFFYMRMRKSTKEKIPVMPELRGGVSWENISVMTERLFYFTAKFPGIIKTKMCEMLEDLRENIDNCCGNTADSTDIEKIQKQIVDGVFALEQTLELMQYAHAPDAEVIANKIQRIKRLLTKLEKST